MPILGDVLDKSPKVLLVHQHVRERTPRPGWRSVDLRLATIPAAPLVRVVGSQRIRERVQMHLTNLTPFVSQRQLGEMLRKCCAGQREPITSSASAQCHCFGLCARSCSPTTGSPMSTKKHSVLALLAGGMLAVTSVVALPDSSEPRRDVIATAASDPVPFQAAPPEELQDFHRIAPTTTAAPPPPTTTTTRPRPTPTTAPAPAPTQAPAPRSNATGDPYDEASWDRLAGCEASGDWSANTGNGYYGGVQFSLSSWQAVGGSGYPHEASRSEQIRRGQLLWEQGGWRHWPGCARKFGWI